MLISPYFILITSLIIIIIYVSIAAYKKIEQKAAAEVFVALIIVLIALFFFGLSLFIANERFRFIFHEMKFITLVFIGPASLRVYLKFTDYSHLISRRQWILLLIIPSLTVIFALTNNFHHFFRQSMYIYVSNGYSYIGTVSSWWYGVYIAYSYIILIAGLLILSIKNYKKPRIYRGQIGAMVATGGLVIVVGILTVFKLVPDNGDLSLVCCSIVCVMQYVTIVNYSSKGVIQQARNLIIGDVDNPVLIFGHNNLLIDANTAALKLIHLILPDFTVLQGRNPLEFERFKMSINMPDKLDNSSNPEGIDGTKVFLRQTNTTYSVSEKLLYDEHWRFTGRAVVLNDISALTETVNELEYITNHDYLTGLLNRRAINHILLQLKESDFPVAVICVNISGTRLINNIFGNTYGDNVIISTANAIKKAAANLADGGYLEKSACARINGDEFGIVLKNASSESAEAFIENINNILHKKTEGKHDITISSGFAVVQDTGCDIGAVSSSIADSLQTKDTQYLRTISPAFLKAIRSSLAALFDESGQRSQRITELCGLIAEKLGLSSEERENLQLLSVMADIGLLSASAQLLKNIGNLNNEEWDEFKLHTVKGYSIAQSTTELSVIAREIISHHERFDGYGYPNGLSGDDIPLLARIFSAVEYYVDLERGSINKNASDIMKSLRGSRFDPEIVDIILELL